VDSISTDILEEVELENQQECYLHATDERYYYQSLAWGEIIAL